MASITKRGTHQYQAIVRVKGYPTRTRTFETRKEAEHWSSTIELQMGAGTWKDTTQAKVTTLKAALERYAKQVTPHKRGATRELGRIKMWLENPLAQLSLADLRSKHFAKYRDDRLKTVASSTVHKELALISHVYVTAKKEWDIQVENPITDVKKPKLPEARDRRLEGDEEVTLLKRAAQQENALWLTACIKLAIESGMRAGEIVTLQWHQVDLSKGIIRLGITKNGCRRTVPLTLEAINILRSLPTQSDKVINGLQKVSSLSHAFKNLCDSIGIENLHFHDLRHEAASRLAPGMTAPILAKIMGWKTLQMAMRYYNPRDEELVAHMRRAQHQYHSSEQPSL